MCYKVDIKTFAIESFLNLLFGFTIIINFFRQVFSGCTEVIATSLIRLDTIPFYLRNVLLSLPLAVPCGLKRCPLLAY